VDTVTTLAGLLVNSGQAISEPCSVFAEKTNAVQDARLKCMNFAGKVRECIVPKRIIGEKLAVGLQVRMGLSERAGNSSEETPFAMPVSTTHKGLRARIAAY
jgi:hypothetical protein